MKKLILLGLLISSSLFANGSHWNEDQVMDYVHYSEYQRRMSGHLLSQLQLRGDEKILDVGCGDGRNTAWLSCLVRRGTVIGIDPSQAMIDWANKQYHPTEFPNLRFLEGDANHLPDEKFDLISALFCLHIVKDKVSALQGFYDRLIPDGRVIAVIPPPPHCNPAFLEALIETMVSPAWGDYFKDFQSTFRFAQLEDYVAYFRSAGFHLIRAEYCPAVDPFVNQDEFTCWFLGTWPHIHRVPRELRRAFVSDMVDLYVQKRPDAVSSDGVLYFYHGRYELIAQKEI